MGATEGARPIVKVKRGGSFGRALQVVVFSAAAGGKYADIDRGALLFGYEEEEGLGEIVVALLLVRLRPEGNQALCPLAGIVHGLGLSLLS